jgi:hypothetical protein
VELGFGLPPLGPGLGLGQQLLEGQESFGSQRMPTAALAFEAAVDVHFDVFLDRARAGFDGGRGAAATAAEGGGDLNARRQCRAGGSEGSSRRFGAAWVAGGAGGLLARASKTAWASA